MSVDLPAPERPMMASHSPSWMTTSMPFKTCTVSSPLPNDLRRFRVSIFMCFAIALIAPEYRVERIFPDDETSRYVSCDDRGEDEESDSEKCAVERSNDDGVGYREHDWVSGDVRNEKSIKNEESDAGAYRRIEDRLQYVRYFYCLSGNADALQNANVLSTSNRIDEYHDEYSDRGNDESDGAERVSELLERIAYFCDTVGYRVVKCLHEGDICNATPLPPVSKDFRIGIFLESDGYLVDVVVVAPNQFAELPLGHKHSRRER